MGQDRPKAPLDWLAGLSSRLKDPIRRVTYPQAEAASKRLAAQLVAAFGHQALGQLQYQAIPRGGLIVLGMLAYVLNLSRHQLSSGPPADTPLVVVDDCSYSGARLQWFLQSVPCSRPVIFAHLFSHPDLRSAILQQEQQVVGCLAGEDLREHFRDRYPDDEYRAWQDRWRQRLGEPRYWLGQPELIVLPWTEPDRPVWNPVSGQVEDHWRFAAPDRCLKNWARLGLPPRAGVRPSLRSPDHVAVNVQEDEVILCDLRTEEIFGLTDVAAEMWRALAAYGDSEAALSHLLTRYDVDEATLRADLDRFIASLLERGLLEPACDE